MTCAILFCCSREYYRPGQMVRGQGRWWNIMKTESGKRLVLLEIKGGSSQVACFVRGVRWRWKVIEVF